jgi:valyl-tRNA synthetase
LRFIASLEEGLAAPVLPPAERLTLADRWILTRLRETVAAVTTAYDRYEMGVAADALIGFGWYTFCDWYLEAAKAPAQRATRAAVLAYTLETLMRLMHPIAPFVTEEIRSLLCGDDSSIVTAPWPQAGAIPAFDDVGRFDAVTAKVEEVRQYRSASGLRPADPVELTAPAGPFDEELALVGALANASVRTGDDGASLPFGAAVRIVADVGAMRDRFTREIARLESEVARGEKKLGNERFVAGAKPEVVAAERSKLDDYRRALDGARDALAKLTA